VPPRLRFAAVPFLLALLLVAIAGCSGPNRAPAPRADAPPPGSLRYKAVLVAGDKAQPVFDNATQHLHDALIAPASPRPTSIA
jgi:hypothetical protein